MPQVSKRKVNEKILGRIEEILLESVLKLKNHQEVFDFLADLLTPTERLMFSKRIAIAILLAKGYEYESIKNILKVRQSTVATVRNRLANSSGGYWKIIKRIIKQKKIRNLFLTIESVLDLAPRSGWHEWGKRKWERKREREKPI